MCNKEEPHTNIKDLPKQLAKINYMLLCLLYVTILCYYVLLYVMLLCLATITLCYYAYFDSVDFPSKDRFHTIGIRSDGFI